MRRRGFTLIEMMVVVVIIGILSGLLLVGVQRVRHAALRAQSANNLRQLQLAVANYETHHGYYPPSWKAATPDASGNINGWSGFTLLLPHMEQGNVYGKIDYAVDYNVSLPVTTADGRSVRVQAIRIPTLISPFEPRDEANVDASGNKDFYPLNYAFNCGEWFVWDPVTKKGGTGAFFPDSRLKPAQFQDGLSHTIGLAEVKGWQPVYRNVAVTDPPRPNLPADLVVTGAQFRPTGGHFEWVDGRVHHVGFTTTFAPNTKVLRTESGVEYDVDFTSQQEGRSPTNKTYAAITARSYHGGGVFVSMMDGSVRFVSDEINLGVWRALGSRSGGELLPDDENLPDLVP